MLPPAGWRPEARLYRAASIKPGRPGSSYPPPGTMRRELSQRSCGEPGEPQQTKRAPLNAVAAQARRACMT